MQTKPSTPTKTPKYDWPESTEKRSLFVTLKPAELEATSRQLAQTVPQIANLEREAKSSASQWKSRIESVQCEQNRLSGIVSDGKEERPVECEWVFECCGIDIASSNRIHHPEKKALFRKDTGEFIEARDITSDERQMSLIADEQSANQEGEEA
jgi:hypothetical protein